MPTMPAATSHSRRRDQADRRRRDRERAPEVVAYLRRRHGCQTGGNVSGTPWTTSALARSRRRMRSPAPPRASSTPWACRRCRSARGRCRRRSACRPAISTRPRRSTPRRDVDRRLADLPAPSVDHRGTTTPPGWYAITLTSVKPSPTSSTTWRKIATGVTSFDPGSGRTRPPIVAVERRVRREGPDTSGRNDPGVGAEEVDRPVGLPQEAVVQRPSSAVIASTSAVAARAEHDPPSPPLHVAEGDQRHAAPLGDRASAEVAGDRHEEDDRQDRRASSQPDVNKPDDTERTPGPSPARQSGQYRLPVGIRHRTHHHRRERDKTDGATSQAAATGIRGRRRPRRPTSSAGRRTPAGAAGAP